MMLLCCNNHLAATVDKRRGRCARSTAAAIIMISIVSVGGQDGRACRRPTMHENWRRQTIRRFTMIDFIRFRVDTSVHNCTMIDNTLRRYFTIRDDSMMFL